MAEAPTLAADWTGKPCPKCGYARTPLDTNPAWQCPRCQVAYAKFAAAAAPVHERLAAHGRQMAARAGSDHSLAALVAANIIALVVAVFMRMGLHDLMLVYWIQSVVIGAMNVIRILKLHRFATDDFQMGDKPVTETAAAKEQVAAFFAMHYGLFHLVYFVFIVAAGHGKLGPLVGYLLCAGIFVAHHAFSLRHNLESDAAGRPNIGTLMFMPYARIIPMHMTILAGALMGGAGTGYLLLFGVLKTGADALMHTVQHHLMSQSASSTDETSP